jgi:tetratricopeptide (TPR) repeat protein
MADYFGRLRKDQETVHGLVQIWEEMQQLREQLSNAKTTQSERSLALTKIRVKSLAAEVSAALAKTENGLGSARVASPESRVRAKQLAQTALELGPEISDAHAAMGDVLSDAEDVQEAEAEYRKALSINPISASGHVKLANALRLAGKLDDAITELREGLRLNADSAPAHTDLGTILALEGLPLRR